MPPSPQRLARDRAARRAGIDAKPNFLRGLERTGTNPYTHELSGGLWHGQSVLRMMERAAR
jgi:hypothetical protein